MPGSVQQRVNSTRIPCNGNAARKYLVGWRADHCLVTNMVALTEDIKAAMATMKAFPVATASADGVPNVVPIAFVELKEDNETIWLADNFMRKTLANIKENPKISINVWGPETKGCWQIKGPVEYKTSGPEYEDMRQTVLAKMAKAPAKGLIIMTITDVYECKPGPEAGKKIL
jgi:predicted pyridoxine 5'-phosphate oxidase superfamily flavin-nucleotide-binding protein